MSKDRKGVEILNARGKWFAEKRDKRWIKLAAPVALMILMLLSVISQVQLGFRAGSADYIVWMTLALIGTAAICGFGYANLKVAFGFSVAGVLAGIIMMMYVFTQPVAQRGIVGLVSGAELAFIFFIAGINAQMIHYLMTKRRRAYGR